MHCLKYAGRLNKVGGVNLEWNKETELFIILIYYVIPVVILGLVLIGVILLLKNLIRFINNNKKKSTK